MIVHASAPSRILDIGSWTDTPFAEYGAALNCAVSIFAHVTLLPRTRTGVTVRYEGSATLPPALRNHFACEEMLRALARYFEVEGFEAGVRTDAAVDSGLGVTAATAVALTAAVAKYAGAAYTPLQLALIAHRIRCEELGRHCGLQSFLTAALGGVNLYRIEPYPRAFATPVPAGTELLDELERRLFIVRSGRMSGKNLYAGVARQFQQGGRRAYVALRQLRALPARAYDALLAGNFTALGAVMQEQASVQLQFCPALNTPEARRLDIFTRRLGGIACKINGMGGSLTILCDPERHLPVQALLQQIGFDVSPIRIERSGVRVWTESTLRRLSPILPALRSHVTT